MATASTLAPLITAEEFASRPDPGYPEELVRGRIVTMPPPGARHGATCLQVGFLLKHHMMTQDLGHVLSNDSGVITARGPDSVRGPDISFYGYDRLPRGPLPEGYPNTPPNLVFEVLSPDDRWPKTLAKVAEYLDAGVTVVAVLDPERRSLQLFRAEAPIQILGETDELTLPDILGDFRVAVGRFFA